MSWRGLMMGMCVGLLSCTSTDTDTDPDTDTDTDAEDVWEWCPSPTDWVGNEDWSHTLVATDSALYCSSFYEGRILEQELAMKAQMRWMAGTYKVPTQAKGEPFVMPICFLLSGQEPPLMMGTGTVESRIDTYGETDSFTLQFMQSFQASTGKEFVLKGSFSSLTTSGESPPVFNLNGTASPVFEGLSFSFQLCEGDESSCFPFRDFLSCSAEAYQWQQHQITFEGGEIHLDLRMGQSMASTEPAAFVRAEGNLDGTDFLQTDYYKLIYNPEHHHFSRDFAVLFDAPIGEVCGLKVLHLDPWGGEPPTEVHTIECDLGSLGTREVLSETFEKDDGGKD